MESEEPKTRYAGNYCSVVGCHNRKGRDSVRFYSFPGRNKEQKLLWIAAVKRVNPDGSPWIPSQSATVCEDHFLKKKPSPTNTDPDYVPSIFPTNHKKAATEADAKRNERQLKRKEKKKTEKENTDEPPQETVEDHGEGLDIEVVEEHRNIQDLLSSLIPEPPPEDMTLQAGATFSPRLEVASVTTQTLEVKKKSVRVGTSHGPAKVGRTQTDFPKAKGFTRMVYGDKDCKALTGVPYSLFCQLCVLLSDSLQDTRAMTKEEKVVLYLFKLRHNNTFSCIAILYGIHEDTVSLFFNQVLDAHYEKGSKFVWWLPRSLIDATMPNVFKLHHPSTRVIIDASEVRCEQPSDVEAQVFLYSSYKSSFTMKFLIGKSFVSLFIGLNRQSLALKSPVE
jgi:hypothetical protein